MMTRLTFTLLFLAASFTALAAKPNFAGDWKMDTAKSDFGDMPSPGELLKQVTHDDTKIVVKEFEAGGLGKLNAEMTYDTPGTSTKNSVRGSEMTSVAKWSGDTLKISNTIALQGRTINLSETWKLTGGGKKLEVLRKIGSPEGKSTMQLVFAKSDK
ncbi:MAG: hypothetical protein FJW31_22595 [Acidobacteria bacterium]|nr:hypothetical protein [Acidobacteriota bacterium]